MMNRTQLARDVGVNVVANLIANGILVVVLYLLGVLAGIFQRNTEGIVSAVGVIIVFAVGGLALWHLLPGGRLSPRAGALITAAFAAGVVACLVVALMGLGPEGALTRPAAVIGAALLSFAIGINMARRSASRTARDPAPPGRGDG